MGSRAAMIRVGDSLAHGGTGDASPGAPADLAAAIEQWTRALSISRPEGGGVCFEDSIEDWDLHERIANAHLELGDGEAAAAALEEAAGAAMAAMKGKLANRYYARMAELS
jgi:hypothetical protein